MANGQPLILGTFNTASLTTSLSASTIAGANKTALIAFGPKAGVGLLGRALALGPNLLSSEIGVAGDAQTTGVFGQSGGGIVLDDSGNVLIAGAGVAGRSGSGGVGVHGACSAGFGVLGQDPSGAGVMGKSVSGAGVAGESNTGPGVSGRSSAQPGVRGESGTSQGAYGKSVSSAGVAGISTSFAGVYGRSTSGVGVHGMSAGSVGVYGSGADEPGVRGDSNTDYGVLGMSTRGNGVHGWSTNGTAGVSGYCPAGRALHGHSLSGYGLFAESASGVAVFGMQNSSQVGTGHAVVGFSQTGFGVAAVSASQPSLYARAGASLAALFVGDVEVRGGFRVIGGPKSAVVPHRDGTHRQLYCVESPESWFEDFGEAVVEGGACNVALDPDFAALVRPDGYQVFLTPYGAAVLYVSKRGAKAFEIRALPGAKGLTPDKVACGYRIVARRADIEAPRLAKVKLADVPELELPKPGKPRPEKAPKVVASKALREPKEVAPAKVPPPPKALDKALLARRPAR
ncbi:MAG: hypothetical protein JNN03_03945 [Rubrivivax sp.]|nr:hypothetical protein [Rubrivivax sp.]